MKKVEVVAVGLVSISHWHFPWQHRMHFTIIAFSSWRPPLSRWKTNLRHNHSFKYSGILVKLVKYFCRNTACLQLYYAYKSSLIQPLEPYPFTPPPWTFKVVMKNILWSSNLHTKCSLTINRIWSCNIHTKCGSRKGQDCLPSSMWFPNC